MDKLPIRELREGDQILLTIPAVITALDDGENPTIGLYSYAGRIVLSDSTLENNPKDAELTDMRVSSANHTTGDVVQTKIDSKLFGVIAVSSHDAVLLSPDEDGTCSSVVIAPRSSLIRWFPDKPVGINLATRMKQFGIWKSGRHKV